MAKEGTGRPAEACWGGGEGGGAREQKRVHRLCKVLGLWWEGGGGGGRIGRPTYHLILKKEEERGRDCARVFVKYVCLSVRVRVRACVHMCVCGGGGGGEGVYACVRPYVCA